MQRVFYLLRGIQSSSVVQRVFHLQREMQSSSVVQKGFNLRFRTQKKIGQGLNNYLLTYDSYVPLYNP